MRLNHLIGVPRRLARHTLFMLASLMATSLSAQESGVVPGRVLDLAGQGIAQALVAAGDGSTTTRSRADGGFELRLRPGPVQLVVLHPSYQPGRLTIQVRPGANDSVRMHLVADPVALRGLSVELPNSPPLGHTVTAATVRQVPPLAEPDVFRAVVLLPGVTQPNDLKGRIHLAGGASDETGITLDGHPLQEPFHLLGIFGAFNVAALERADVLIHHLGPELDGRLSGVLAMESRHPAPQPALEAGASLLSASATALLPAGILGMDMLASARMTYLDWILPHLSPSTPLLGFREALLRGGRCWGAGWRAELLGFTTQDRFRDPTLRAFDGYEPLTWGESLLGARIQRRGGRWSMAARASFNRATVHLDERGTAGTGTNFVDSQRDWWSASLRGTLLAPRWSIVAGGAADWRSFRQAWVARGLTDEIFSPNMPAEYAGTESQRLLAGFAEARAELGEHWSFSAGGRLGGRDAFRLAPRLNLTFAPAAGLEIEAAYDRRYQWDAQLEEPVEGSVTAPTFLLERPRQADVVALAARLRHIELPRGGWGTLHLQAFRKLYRDRAVLAERAVAGDRAPAADTATTFPRFERITGYSMGAMFGGQLRLARAGLLQGSYTYQQAREEIAGVRSPTAWDAPHTLALFGSLVLGRGWVFNSVFQAHSGRATTPVLARLLEPQLDNFNQLSARYLRGARNSVRVPAYRRLDVGAPHIAPARGRGHRVPAGAEPARPRQRHRLRLAAVLRLASGHGRGTTGAYGVAHTPEPRGGGPMVTVRLLRAAAATLALSALLGGCDDGAVLVPEGDEPFLYLVLNQPTFSGYSGQVGQHALLASTGSPLESPHYREAQRFDMWREGESHGFAWSAYPDLTTEPGTPSDLAMTYANYYLPEAGSNPALGAEALLPGKTYELEIATHGSVVRGRATIPAAFSLSVELRGGKRTLAWPRVHGAGGYRVMVPSYPAYLQSDTSFAVPDDSPGNQEAVITALDENLYHYLTDGTAGRAGIEGGYGVFGAVSVATVLLPSALVP